MTKIEKPAQLKNFSLSANNMSAGLFSGLLAITGASLLVLEAAQNGGYTDSQTFSWVFSVYLFGGLFGILLPLYYKVPITGAHSLAGIIYLGTLTPVYSFDELVSGFIVSALLVLLLGISGWINKLLTLISRVVIAAMLAGMILNTLISLCKQFGDGTWMVIAITVCFFTTPLVTKKVPGLLVSLFLSLALLTLSGNMPSVSPTNPPYFTLFKPEFSLASIFVIGIPLCLFIFSNDFIVGLNELSKESYKVSVKKVVNWSGIFSLIGSFFGSHCTNLAGIMTSICAGPSAGNKKFRYVASVISGMILLIFAFFSSYLIPFIKALPKGVPAIIAFLTLYGVFISSIRTILTDKSSYSATLPTLVITATNIHIFIFNGPLLGLIVGLMTVYIRKRKYTTK